MDDLGKLDGHDAHVFAVAGKGCELVQALPHQLVVRHASKPCPGHGMLVLGKGASLVGADVGGVSHGLAGLKLADEVLVLKHLPSRIGEADGHGKREALGNGHHDDGHSDDESVDQGVEPGLVGVGHAVHDHEGDEGGHGRGGSEVADELGHHGELALKRGLGLLFLVLRESSLARLRADGKHQHVDVLPAVEDGAAEKEGVFLLYRGKRPVGVDVHQQLVQLRRALLLGSQHCGLALACLDG